MKIFKEYHILSRSKCDIVESLEIWAKGKNHQQPKINFKICINNNVEHVEGKTQEDECDLHDIVIDCKSKIMSPTSQERLCQATKRGYLIEDSEIYKCKRKLHFKNSKENETSQKTKLLRVIKLKHIFKGTWCWIETMPLLFPNAPFLRTILQILGIIIVSVTYVGLLILPTGQSHLKKSQRIPLHFHRGRCMLLISLKPSY